LMAHGLNLKVVAEGIETPEQLTVLRELDSDIAQGFFLSRPLKSTAFETLLEQDLVIETE
ncbi:MAG: EAL domain-containing protein, partial [Pontibacterium sp.]